MVVLQLLIESEDKEDENPEELPEITFWNLGWFFEDIARREVWVIKYGVAWELVPDSKNNHWYEISDRQEDGADDDHSLRFDKDTDNNKDSRTDNGYGNISEEIEAGPNANLDRAEPESRLCFKCIPSSRVRADDFKAD